MRPEKALSWYRRMSMLYGLGAWTLLGSLFLYNQRKSKPPGTALGRDLWGTRGLAWGVSGGSQKWLRCAARRDQERCLEPRVIVESASNDLLEPLPRTLLVY